MTATGKRERNKLANREQILDAGRRVFADVGYDAATIRDIVRETSLSTGTFYNYFPDKQAVLDALVDTFAGELRARVRAARAAAQSLEQLVGDAYRAFFAFLAEDPLGLAMLRRNAGATRALSGTPILAMAVDELLEDLDAAIAAGELPPLDTDYLSGAMAGVGLELAIRMAERDPVDVDGAAAFATELFLGGIARLGQRPAAVSSSTDPRASAPAARTGHPCARAPSPTAHPGRR